MVSIAVLIRNKSNKENEEYSQTWKFCHWISYFR